MTACAGQNGRGLDARKMDPGQDMQISRRFKAGKKIMIILVGIIEWV
jgi:hypothetical protein